ncbi:uncharacterized protein LOC128984736 [Macrosteles quadrilineatus]|uniref:uncharacterized protein LOC128984736 n=1 Tax=Macrosteles quadrilineatus TaxID=74068 RepID=UPI0023E15000|nr:uncharacterized protein LOC128984736 [Macrosteles quadrilineatus]
MDFSIRLTMLIPSSGRDTQENPETVVNILRLHRKGRSGPRPGRGRNNMRYRGRRGSGNRGSRGPPRRPRRSPSIPPTPPPQLPSLPPTPPPQQPPPAPPQQQPPPHPPQQQPPPHPPQQQPTPPPPQQQLLQQTSALGLPQRHPVLPQHSYPGIFPPPNYFNHQTSLQYLMLKSIST